MAPSRGPFSEMEWTIPALRETLVARFLFNGKRSMENRVFEYDVRRLRRKKGVKLEYLKLRFDKEKGGTKSQTEEELGKMKMEWRKEMAALRKALWKEVKSEVKPLGGEVWRMFCAETDKAIRREVKRREKENEDELVRQQLAALQQDIQRWWEAYGESQGIIHDVIPRLYEKRRIRGETFTMNRRTIEATLLGLYKKKLEMQQEEEKRIKREKEEEKEMERDRRRSRDKINELEECWEGTKRWCAESSVGTSGEIWNWCPEVEWRFLTQGQKRREELTQWAEEYYTERWVAWEGRNMRDLEIIDRKAEVMTERRKEMIKVRNWKGNKNVLRELIEESIDEEKKSHATKERKLDEESTGRTTREARRQRKRSLRDQTRSHGGIQIARTRVTAWEWRKRERMEMWEAPPPGPPLRWEVRGREGKKKAIVKRY